MKECYGDENFKFWIEPFGYLDKQFGDGMFARVNQLCQY